MHVLKYAVLTFVMIFVSNLSVSNLIVCLHRPSLIEVDNFGCGMISHLINLNQHACNKRCVGRGGVSVKRLLFVDQ